MGLLRRLGAGLGSLGLASLLAFSGCKDTPSMQDYKKTEIERIEAKGDTIELGILSTIYNVPICAYGISDKALKRAVITRQDKTKGPSLDCFVYCSNEIKEKRAYLDGREIGLYDNDVLSWGGTGGGHDLKEGKKKIFERTSFLMLDNIKDGEHKLRFEVEDKTGKVISREVFFYLTSTEFN